MVLLYIILAIGIITAIPLINLIFLKSQTFQRMVLPLIAMAAGVLLGNSFFHLIPETLEIMTAEEVIWLVTVGFLLTFGIEIFMRWHSHVSVHHHKPKKKPVGYLVLFDDIIHNAVDAVAITSTFLLSVPLGIVTAIAVALHEIPHEIGDYAVLVNSGFSKGRALAYNFISEFAAFGGVALVLLFNLKVESLAAFSAFTAGVFLYIAAVDLIPELHHESKKGNYIISSLIVIAGVLLMYALKLAIPEA